MAVSKPIASPKSFADLPDILTPVEVTSFLRIGRNGVYGLLKSGRLRSIRIGQKFIITKAALAEFAQWASNTTLPGPEEGPNGQT
jgi:excisionase family DNA binding protein